MKKIAVLLVNNNQSRSEISRFEPEINPLPYLSKHANKQFYLSKSNAIEILKKHLYSFDVFLNLCDGAEGDDRPGIEVVQFLEQHKIPFTGASSSFYEPSRKEMKNAALACKVLIPNYQYINVVDELNYLTLSFPIIVKHYNSYSSIGLTKKSIVYNFSDLVNQVQYMLKQYKGVLLEEYIKGDEYTVLVESINNYEVEVFYPAKIIFPPNEEFKHFDLKWQQHNLMKYIPCPNASLAKKLMENSYNIYKKMNGNGYARFDYRVNNKGEIYFIELNPNCSLFYPSNNASSADEILSFNKDDKQKFVDNMLNFAMQRFK
ncbi:MAG: hypothetical protein ACUVQP_08300 [Bacteroidales bacterium]